MGETTAGTSGGRNLTEGTNPPTGGTVQNGYTPGLFDGTNDLLTADLTADDYIGASSVTVHAVVWVNSAPAPSTYAFEDPCVIVAQYSGIYGLGVSSSGVRFGVYLSTGYVETAPVALSTGAWHVIQARYDGTNVSVRVDGGAWTDAAATDPFAAGGFPALVGVDIVGTTQFLDGEILELGIHDGALSDVECDALYSYAIARYGTVVYTSRCITTYLGRLVECPDVGPFGLRLVLSGGVRTTATAGGKSLVLVGGSIVEASSEVGVRTP